MSQSKHIAVIGSGPMGAGIAQIFAANGHEVTLFDRKEAALRAAIVKIESNLHSLSHSGLGVSRGIPSAIERINLLSDLGEAISGARFVVETMEQNLSVKQELFREMEKYCSPVTVLSTNTSKFPISKVVAHTEVKERAVGTHFWNPPCLIPVVEVTGSPQTLPAIKDYVCNLLLSVGMRPVLLNRDTPGALGHRLEQALRREALSIVDEGIASQKDLEEVLKSGVGPRLSALGLLTQETNFSGEKASSIRYLAGLVQQQISQFHNNKLGTSKK